VSEIFIDGATSPNEIKAQLKALSKDIAFSRESLKGGNGYLYFGVNRILKTKVAVKFYYWGGDSKFHVEPSTLATINSPNVLSVNSAGLLDGNWAYFVTPYCEHGDLDEVIRKTAHGNILAVDRTCQLLIGVGALHEHRFLHRDLKPANIYVGIDNESIIGDFGSIKHIPAKEESIPASGHAVLYRPPESIGSNCYGFCGDIYQSVIVLYQLLGGSLPYDEVSWLNKAQRKSYDEFSCDADKSIFADECLKARISNGKILDISSLPPWVPDCLKRTIRKATHIEPSKRFQSASAFHVHLNNLRSKIPDWQIQGGLPTRSGVTAYRVVEENNRLFIQKRRNAGAWRRDNSFNGSTIRELVAEVEHRA